jgi:hypothetical protein
MPIATNLCPTDALPPPSELGAPEKFADWRSPQIDAVMRMLESPYRFNCFVVPTGGGKSLIPIVLSLLGSKRVLILTSTKSLQHQYLRDFTESGLKDIRGQGNYECLAARPDGELSRYGGRRRGGIVSVEDAPCHEGIRCVRKTTGGCLYYDAVREASQSQIVISNYAYWLSLGRAIRMKPDVEDPLGVFDLIVLDEAHDAPERVCDALRIELPLHEVRTLLGMKTDRLTSIPDWQEWSKDAMVKAAGLTADLKAQLRRDQDDGLDVDFQIVDELRQLSVLMDTLRQISTLKGDWEVGHRDRGTVATFDPVWGSPYCEKLLFRGIEHVLLMSATVREKTLEYLGIDLNECQFVEYDSHFSRQAPSHLHHPHRAGRLRDDRFDDYALDSTYRSDHRQTR